MVNRWFGQRWDCEGEEPAVALFVNDLLQNKKQKKKKTQKKNVLQENRIVLNSFILDLYIPVYSDLNSDCKSFAQISPSLGESI